MDWPSLFAVAVALALDAFAVAIASGISLGRFTERHVFRLSFHFGLFQALMPIIGWSAGIAVHRYIAAFDHWIALALLSFVGGKMIIGAIGNDGGEKPRQDPTRGWSLVVLSIATSIDALAVGLSLAMLGMNILKPALVIGIIAAAFTVAGMVFGRGIGKLWGKRVEILGGMVLVGIGLKILVEHMSA